MASYPSIDFPKNEIPQTFNKNAFVSKVLQSDNVLTSSLNVLGTSTLNTLQSNTINNTIKYYNEYWCFIIWINY